MVWVFVSFLCSLQGCTPLPDMIVPSNVENTALNCRQIRQSFVQDWERTQNVSNWIEGYCTLREQHDKSGTEERKPATTEKSGWDNAKIYYWNIK